MKQLNILVAEDDALIAALLAEVLRSMGHVVSATEDTEAGAIAAAFRCRPDLMIIDEQLGLGSGLTVVEQVVRQWPIPYVLVSGDTFRIKRLMPHAVIMEKPYHDTELAQSIRRAMGCEDDAEVSGSRRLDAGDIRCWPPVEAPCRDP